jgi:cytochrome P450
MLYLITSPHAYSSLQAEIDRAVLEGKISSPVITDKEARELPYLQAAIKEGLRIFPPGTGLMAKKVPPEGDKIGNVFLPPGTKIGVNMWALRRRRDVFGEDAEVFRPERWLEASPEELEKMEAVSELVWGYGKYVCLGKSVALIELNKIFVEVSVHYEAFFDPFGIPAAGTYSIETSETDKLGQLLRNFNWTLVDPTNPMKSSCYGIFVMSGLWVVVTERTTKKLK